MESRLAISACSAARVRNPCRIEENSEKMIVNMAVLEAGEGIGKLYPTPLKFNCSTRTEFLVGTGAPRASDKVA